MREFRHLLDAIKVLVYRKAVGFASLCAIVTIGCTIWLTLIGEAYAQGEKEPYRLWSGIATGCVLLLAVYGQVKLTGGLDWRRALATSVGCRVLSPECEELFRRAKATGDGKTLRVRGFFYLIRDEEFFPAAFWRESGTSLMESGDGDVDAHSTISFQDASESKLVIWDAYNGPAGRAVRDISAVDAKLYRGKCKRVIDPNIRTVLAIKLQPEGRQSALISFTCNQPVSSVWNTEQVWDIIVRLEDKFRTLVPNIS